MSGSFRILALSFALATLSLLSACKPPASPPPGTPEPTPAPTPTPPPPTPTPSPTPIFIPRKTMETARLYNGIELRTTLEHSPGDTATAERAARANYAVEVKVKVTVPAANRDLSALSKLNPALPTLLPGLAAMLPGATVSPDYDELYGRKLRFLEHNLPRLEALLSRHNFYDCETILELRHPESGQRVLLLQSEMDIDTDGSDGDRIPNPEGKDRFFQPMTSYHWPKRTTVPNPFLAPAEARLAAVMDELKLAKGKGAGELQAIRNRIGSVRYEVNQLRSKSFLISEADPFIVLPSFMLTRKQPGEYTPRLGDYCAVIYKETFYPAIVGDAGPSFKSGEASFRMARELNARSSLISRPVSDLKVTYVVFPGSADPEPGPPDLDRWHTRVGELLATIGGHGGTLHRWETLAVPAPTPTPLPTPAPEPTAEPLLVEGSTPRPVQPAIGAATGAASPAPTPASSAPIAPSAPTPTPELPGAEAKVIPPVH